MIKKSFFYFLIICAGIFGIKFCFAASGLAGEITLIMPEAKTIAASMPKRVVINNPAIADVERVTENAVVIMPKSAGKTTLVIIDRTGEKTYPIRVLADNLDEIKRRVDALISELGFAGVYSVVNKDEGKVLVLGAVEENERKKLDTVLAGLRDKIMDMVEVKSYSQLVQIDVEILEISKSELEKLGFNWTTLVDSTATAAVKWTEGSDQLSNDIYKLSTVSRIWDRGAISAQLNLIITQGKGRVLSRPKLVCLNGKEASFLVGGEIPVVTVDTSAGGTSTKVEYKDYGISLDIKPLVKPDGFVQAALKTFVTEIDRANSVTASGIDIPAFTKRSAETELYLKEEQTVFIAGLIKSNDSKNLSKFPALGDIPILGALFRSKEFTLGETELVISLTPRVIRPEPREETGASIAQTSANIGSSKTLLDYTLAIQNKISKAVVYPELARKNNAEGEVRLSLHILRDGRLLNVLLNKSSGSKLLDDASLNLVKKQAPFPPLPSASDIDEIWIDVPIVFSNK